MNTSPKPEQKQPIEDEILRRLLSTPPKPKDQAKPQKKDK